MCFRNKKNRDMPIRKNFQLCDGIRCHPDTNRFVETEADLAKLQEQQKDSTWFWQRVD